MNHPKHTFRNIILPAMILFPLLLLMVGCLYIPTPEHVVLLGTKQDFRQWATENSTSRPASFGTLTRQNIESLFGAPKFISNNGNCVAYVLDTEHGITIWPQCMGAGFNEGDVHVLKIVYDHEGQLHRISMVKDKIAPPMYWFFAQQYGSDYRAVTGENLLRENNRTCPPEERIELPAPTLNYMTWPN